MVSAEHPAQQPGPRKGRNAAQSLTAAPVCCSGWFGTDRAEQSRDDRTTASRPLSATRPPRPARLPRPPPQPAASGHDGDGRNAANRADGGANRDCRPTAPRDGDNDMSAACWTPPRRGLSAEQPAQQPGPQRDLYTPERLTAAPVCCSDWFGTDRARGKPRRPDYRIKAPAATGPSGGRPGRTTPPTRAAATGTPRRRAGRAPSSGCRLRRRQRPGPLPLLTTTCQRQRARTLSAVECRTPSSAAGAAAGEGKPQRLPRSAARLVRPTRLPPRATAPCGIETSRAAPAPPKPRLAHAPLGTNTLSSHAGSKLFQTTMTPFNSWAGAMTRRTCSALPRRLVLKSFTAVSRTRIPRLPTRWQCRLRPHAPKPALARRRR